VSSNPYATDFEYWMNRTPSPGDAVVTPSGEMIFAGPNGWVDANRTLVPGPESYDYLSWWSGRNL
jgi:hypothetical protein